MIIFDNAHTYADIEPYVLFSHDKTIHTLVTSKNGNFANHTIQIKPFNREDSFRYINLFLKDAPDCTKNQLAKHLGDCPAALAMAIDYIKSYPGMTIDRYLHEHKKQKGCLPFLAITSKKLGSSVDGYEKDLLVTIQINMKELQQRSIEAFQFLSLLSLLHRDEISLALLEKWVKAKGIKTDITTLIALINQYSLIEITDLKNKSEAYITMQDLIQEIVSSLVPVAEKKKLIFEAAKILKESFSDRGDTNLERIRKDNKPLLNTIKLSGEAHSIAYHLPELTYIRIRALDLLTGIIRDYPTIEELLQHLEDDFKAKVSLSKQDEVLYNAIMSLYSGTRSPDYHKALSYGLKALNLAQSVDNMNEERIRIIANLVQYSAFAGRGEESAKYITMGERLLPFSRSDSYNALFIIAKNAYLLDKGDFQQIVDLILQN